MTEMASGPSTPNLNPIHVAAEADGQPSEEMLFNVVQAAQLAVLEKPPAYMQNAGTKITARQARAWTYPHSEAVPPPVKFAHKTLANRYMPLAAGVAKVSMGLRPARELQEMVYPGDQDLLADLSRMRSPQAVLADRTQVASVALLESIWTYSVTNRRYQREPFLFSWYAVRRMYTALREHAVTDELFAFTPDVVEDYHALQAGEAGAAFAGAARQTELKRLRGLTEVASFDELTDEGLADARADAPFDAVYFREFLEQLKEWFGERHMEYFLRAHGLEGGGPAGRKEIAEELGVSRSQVDELHRRCNFLLDLSRKVMRKAWYEGTPLPSPPHKSTIYLRDEYGL
ncbi:MAG TPA: hypothetical protein VLG11_02105 [Candidatus Saccharimonadales bacterium]|nr:hypothetical protein [Candidatus Saccharimonadales bacterium]